MDRIMEKLIMYGINVDEVMARFVDDEELYIECFVSFLSDELFDALGRALESRDFDLAFAHAHTLKGVCANLGLTPLYHSICVVVESLRNGEYADLEQQYMEVCRERDVLLKLLGTEG